MLWNFSVKKQTLVNVKFNSLFAYNTHTVLEALAQFLNVPISDGSGYIPTRNFSTQLLLFYFNFPSEPKISRSSPTFSYLTYPLILWDIQVKSTRTRRFNFYDNRTRRNPTYLVWYLEKSDVFVS